MASCHETTITAALPEPVTVTCLYCHNNTFVPHYDQVHDRLHHVRGNWAFIRCTRCHSLRLQPFPLLDEIPGFYPPVYSFRPDSASGSRVKRLLTRLEYHFFYGPQYRAQTRAVLRGIRWRGERGLRLLDVGCGPGLRLRAFKQRGFDVHGIDMQTEVIEYVKKEIGVDATVDSIESLCDRFAPASFDVITAFYLLEHIPDVRKVLEGCHRLLRPNGWFVAVVPICDGLQARLFGDRWIHVREAPRHLSLPSRRGLLGVADETGYTNVSIRSDSLLNCAGIVGGSLIPGSDLTATYGGGPWRLAAFARRLVGGFLTICSLPFCTVENYVMRQTSHGMLFAQREPDQNS